MGCGNIQTSSRRGRASQIQGQTSTKPGVFVTPGWEKILKASRSKEGIVARKNSSRGTLNFSFSMEFESQKILE
jgi:hypothetical protein